MAGGPILAEQPASSEGAAALTRWIEQRGKGAFDSLWMACGWGAITATAVCKGEILPDENIADALAMVTQGAVTLEMFDRPAA